jgi:hypothetical protein
MQVPRATWRRLCTCPGTDQARRKLDEAAEEEFPDFADFREKARRARQIRDDARREAFDAARTAAAGKSREQVREIYAAELRSRGLAVPADQILDAYAAAIAGNRLPAGLPIYLLTEIGKDFGKLMKIFRNVKTFRVGE